ncbi:MAG: hypothetical protein HY648_08420 [Acidobacteria bacterium]|nr:hypothetical protein [Acidobacteriota bacterium]
MPTVMLMEWLGITQEQYEQVMRTLDLDKNPPSGANFHVAGFTGEALRVLDIWESQQDFERFQRERLNSAAQKAGISGTPKVIYYPVHNIYAPNVESLRMAGRSGVAA